MRVTGKKPFYLTLEAIRGLAAILVFARHASDPAGTQFLFHASLAVDLFFVLSGFVLGSAYDQRLAVQGLSTMVFMKKRFIRLYPLFLLASCIALLAALLALTYWGGDLTSYVIWLPDCLACSLPYSRSIPFMTGRCVVFYSAYFEFLDNRTNLV